MVDYTFTRPDGTQLGTQGKLDTCPSSAEFYPDASSQRIVPGCKIVRFFALLTGFD